MTMVERILTKHKGPNDYIGGNTIEMYKDNLLEAMKEIASIAFDAGENYGKHMFSSSVMPENKEQFIDNMFNNE